MISILSYTNELQSYTLRLESTEECFKSNLLHVLEHQSLWHHQQQQLKLDIWQSIFPPGVLLPNRDKTDALSPVAYFTWRQEPIHPQYHRLQVSPPNIKEQQTESTESNRRCCLPVKAPSKHQGGAFSYGPEQTEKKSPHHMQPSSNNHSTTASADSRSHLNSMVADADGRQQHLGTCQILVDNYYTSI